MDDGRNYGHVEEHEVSEAVKLIDDEFIKLTGRPYQYKVAGYFLGLKIYTRPEEIKEITRDDGTKTKLYFPQKSLQGDKYQSCTALVCGMGPGAYHPSKFPEGPWCRIGDWVVIPRYECHLIMYRGVPFGELPDDRILGVVNDPRDIEPINLKDEF